jgi:hypothetical protein
VESSRTRNDRGLAADVAELPGECGCGVAAQRTQILSKLRGNACLVFSAAQWARAAIVWGSFPGQTIAVRRAALERTSNLTWPATFDSNARVGVFQRASPFQARHSKSNPGTLELQHGHASATTWRSGFQVRRDSAAGVNTDISEPHARTTKRAGPERAFERDALTGQRATAHSIPVASAHSRTQGRNAQRTHDATIATNAHEPAKLWRESASATNSDWPAVGAATCSPPLRAGSPAARRQAESLAAGVTGADRHRRGWPTFSGAA